MFEEGTSVNWIVHGSGVAVGPPGVCVGRCVAEGGLVEVLVAGTVVGVPVVAQSGLYRSINDWLEPICSWYAPTAHTSLGPATATLRR